MKKILFILPNLSGGGAERVILTLCQNLNLEKYDITLCLLQKKGRYLDLIPKNIRVLDLNIKRVRYSVLPIVFAIYKNKPDIVFSTLGHLNALIGALSFLIPKQTKILAREANIVSKKNYNFIIKWFYKNCYKNFDLVIAQSQDMIDDLNTVISIDKGKIIKINNPINYKFISDQIKSNENLYNSEKINLLSVGSYTKQKGYDILLKSFSKFKYKHKYHLTLLGEGPLLNELHELVDRLGLSKEVCIKDFVSNPFIYMKQADIFISSSRYEGFPNVVLESLACDTPVISNDYLGGINEIINSSLLGEIIDMSESLLFEKTCETIIIRKYKKHEIKEEILSRYGLNKIIEEYETVLDKL